MSNFSFKKKCRKLMALIAFSLTACTALAQTSVSTVVNSDEQTIRNMVAQIDKEGKMNFTDDRIFVSGAFPYPMIGKEMSAENQIARENVKKRMNYKTSSHIKRLQIAQSGDIAYEFGLADLSWDTSDNKHVAFESSYLRVWRKVDGQWKVDVFFARPNGDMPHHPDRS